ncbi:MAG: HlyD family efflux transporter periplasmic adaptor subunit [Patescibacteria group bacterium]
MTVPKILKRKSTYLILVIVLALGGWWWLAKSGNKTTYDTAAVEKRDLYQTVEVTGELKPAERIELAFQNSGKIKLVNVKVGDQVKLGDVLAQLVGDDVVFSERNARAALRVAQANLNAKIAGETPQAIRVAETAVEQAQAAYLKAQKELEATKKTTLDAVATAQSAVDTAQNGLNNSGAITQQNIDNAYASARTALATALGPLQTGLTDGDQITAVDNTAANANYSTLLGILDAGSMDRAKSSYATARDSKKIAEAAVNALNTASTKEQIQAAADKLQTTIGLVQSYLSDVQKVLAASLTSSYFTSTDLAAKKTVIDTDRTAVSTQNTTILTATQTLKNTELTRTQSVSALQDALKTAQIALATAQTNADVEVKAGETAVTVQKAALDAAKAALDLKRAGPRAVDLAPLRAAVEQAKSTYDKTLNDLKKNEILAPVDGVISEVLPDVGEQITLNVTVINMVGTASYDIEAKVPETDIPKIEIGQSAVITLDAYGDDVKFKGTVSAKDPAETKVQDAVYYKIRVKIEPTDKEIKPSMTANVTVTTAEAKDSLVIPLRAIRTSDGSQRSVRVLVNGAPQDRQIEIGLKGDEGKVQVTKGLTEGEQVITSEKTGA